ncbi:putative membrane protein [Kosakonia radicincitans YD4]|jgi:hypothetical protein|nr:putative membrane protein [Kosakonia radicincitans YD4]
MMYFIMLLVYAIYSYFRVVTLSFYILKDIFK